MTWFLYFISMVWIAIGSCVILYTSETRGATKTVISNLTSKQLAFLPFVVGILLVLSASASTHPGIIRILGAIAMIKGAFFYFNPQNFYHKTIAWYLEALSDQAHRFTGILTVILGTAVLSWIK